MIAPADYEILKAFLERESRMYRWDKTGEEGRKAFVERMFKSIVEARPSEGFNYVHIQSITNIGALDSELVLSANHLDILNRRIKCTLPPSPTGRVGFYHERLRQDDNPSP